MKVIFEDILPGEDEEIIIKCHDLHPDLINLLKKLKTQGVSLNGYVGSTVFRLNPADIYYIDTVDNKVFMYDESNVYESKQKLYELEEALSVHDFVRVSKSVLINLRKIKSLVPTYSGRMEIVLYNDEKIACSRQYINDLKSLLGI